VATLTRSREKSETSKLRYKHFEPKFKRHLTYRLKSKYTKPLLLIDELELCPDTHASVPTPTLSIHFTIGLARRCVETFSQEV